MQDTRLSSVENMGSSPIQTTWFKRSSIPEKNPNRERLESGYYANPLFKIFNMVTVTGKWNPTRLWIWNLEIGLVSSNLICHTIS